MLRCWTSAAFAALILCGCATLAEDGGGVGKPLDGLTCADVSYSATMIDGREARRIAEMALAARVKDSRGDMLTAGFRKLRYERQPTRCEYIGGPAGETHCKAIASVCGR